MTGQRVGLEKMVVYGPGDGSIPGSLRFWAEIGPAEHLVQFYENGVVFLDTLEGFVAGGLKAGEGVILIATEHHRSSLEDRLRTRGFDLAKAAAEEQYLALDAQETLDRFMVQNPGDPDSASWPDEARFSALISDLLRRAGTRPDGSPRRVRAFGEMVAILWAEGRTAATLRLEHLWHDMCRTGPLCLFCAYPRAYFKHDPERSIEQICATHSMLVAG